MSAGVAECVEVGGSAARDSESATCALGSANAPRCAPVLDGARFATAAVDAEGMPLFAAALLEPGEIIVGLWRPSLWFVPLRCARMVVVLALVTVLAATGAETAELAWSGAIVQLGALGIAGTITATALDWGSRAYVLTDRRVLRRRGVLVPSLYSCSLQRLKRIEVGGSIWQRLSGVGTLTFSARAEGPADAAWVMVARAAEVHALVLETKRRYGR